MLNIGAIVAIIVLVVCVVAILVPTLPVWLPYALIAALSLAILLGGIPLTWRP